MFSYLKINSKLIKVEISIEIRVCNFLNFIFELILI